MSNVISIREAGVQITSAQIDITDDNFEFTEEHIAASIYYFNREAHPKMYGAPIGTANRVNARYIGTKLLSMEEVCPDNVSGRQRVRQGENEEFEHILRSFKKAYDFTQMLPIVVYDPKKKLKISDKEYIMVGGRTRHKTLTIMRKKFIMADIFTVNSIEDFDDLAAYENTYAVDKPKGFAKEKDIATYFYSLQKDGVFDPSKMTYQEIWKYVEDKISLLEAESIISHRKIKDLVMNIVDNDGRAAPYSTYTNVDHARRLGEEDGCVDTDKVKYVYINTNVEKFLQELSKALVENPNKELRLIAWSTSLCNKSAKYSNDPRKDYEQRILGFWDIIRDYLKGLNDSGISVKIPDRVKFFGCMCMLPNTRHRIDSVVVQDKSVDFVKPRRR